MTSSKYKKTKTFHMHVKIYQNKKAPNQFLISANNSLYQVDFLTHDKVAHKNIL